VIVLSAEFVKSATRPSEYPAPQGREVAFCGRSNVGKSSGLNALTQRRSLARVSRTPGRTRLINFFAVTAGETRENTQEITFADLPGYGYAKVPRPVREHWRGLLDRYFRERNSLAALFLVMDARRPLSETDWQMLGFARACGRAAHLLLTKCDKLSRSAAASTLARVRREVGDQATIAKVNVDEEPALASRFGVQAIPQLVFFKDGVEKDRLVGAAPKREIVKRLDTLRD